MLVYPKPEHWNTWSKVHKTETHKFTAIARYFKSPLSIIERAIKEKNQGEYKRFKQLSTNLAWGHFTVLSQ